MVLVAMREDEALKLLALFQDEGQVRHDDVDAGLHFAGERDAEIDHQPAPVIRWSVAIQIAVHADFADAAKRQEYQFGLR